MHTTDISYFDIAMGEYRAPTERELEAIENEANATAALEYALTCAARGESLVTTQVLVALWRDVEDARSAVVHEVGE